jgi:hypothetical protein
VRPSKAPVEQTPALETMWSDKVFCQNCKQFKSFQRCRVMSKHLGNWRCHTCSVKCVQLRRLHGSWPTEQFMSLSEDSQPPTYFEIPATCCLATPSLHVGWRINVSGPILCLQH